jgi:hypothetical protein
MSAITSKTFVLGLALACAWPAPLGAQLAEAADTELWALSLDSGGGGAASAALVAHLALEPLALDGMSSQHYSGSFGFLTAAEPGQSQEPVILGVLPESGPIAGGTLLAITGLHFDALGSPFSLDVEIGGEPAAQVTVVSSSLITAVSPAGASGPHDVVVAGPFGSVSRDGGFIHTPAILSTPIVPLGSVLELRNYGTPGGQFVTFAALGTLQHQTKFGLLLIGPLLYQLHPPLVYPTSDGIATLSVGMPVDPVLHGLSIHFQSLSLAPQALSQAVLTNLATTLVP